MRRSVVKRRFAVLRDWRQAIRRALEGGAGPALSASYEEAEAWASEFCPPPSGLRVVAYRENAWRGEVVGPGEYMWGPAPRWVFGLTSHPVGGRRPRAIRGTKVLDLGTEPR